MGAPTVPFKVLADGYSIESAQEGGYRATVPYLVAWADAFTFHDDIMLQASAAVVGPITYAVGYQFPGAPSAKLFAVSARIEPCGCTGEVLPDGAGLVPGEFFAFAKITAIFEGLRFAGGAGGQDDLHQLDPENPITYCEQSLSVAGHSETRPKEGYVSDGIGKTPAKDPSFLIPETELILTFPKVPFLPWAKIRPYIGTLNSVAVLGCPIGTLMLAGMNTDVTATNRGIMNQRVQLRFLSQEEDWNTETMDDGTRAKIHLKGQADTVRPLKYKDFREIFL